MKIWQKSVTVNELVEHFTVGNDRVFDLQMAAFDVLGSLAHTKMLNSIGLMDDEELNKVQVELKKIYRDIENGQFTIIPEVEDVHSQVELLLPQRVG